MPVPAPARSARFATSAVFLAHGLLVSAWVSRIPDIQQTLSLSEGVLGTALLGIALGSLASMPVTGVLIGRYGSRVVTLGTTCLFCLAVAAIPAGSNAPALSALLVFYGAAAGAMDVAMNAQAVTVQQAAGRSIMSSFHALFSIGGMLGAFGGGQVARLGIPVGIHLVVTGVVCLALTLAVWRRMLPDEEFSGSEGAPAFALPRGPVVALGALGFCLMLCEGAMADWIAIFLRDFRAAGPATAAAGYAVFSGAMSVGRLFGDAVTDRIGAVNTVRFGGWLAVAGLTAALISGEAEGSLAGLVIVGLGYAAIVPNVFAAAGRVPGVAPGAGIAAVTTMGYFGFLIGPPAIGWLAEWVGLRNALFALVVLSAAGAMLGGSLRAARAGKGTAAFEPDPHG